MSYIPANEPTAKYSSSNPNPGATDYSDSTTWMPLDILAVQRLYGVATTGPLSGGQVFGYHDNVDGTVDGVGIHDYFDFSAITTPVVTLYDTGTGNTLDLSGDNSMETIDLRPGDYSSFAGDTDNLAIAYNTAIDTFVGGTAGTNVTVNSDADTINDQGTNNFVDFSGTRASYTLTTAGTAKILVTNIASGITDTLSGVQTLVFSETSVNTSSILSAPPTVVLATTPTADNVHKATLGTASSADPITVTLTSDNDFAPGSSTIALTGGSLVYTPGLVTAAKAGSDVIKYTVTDTTTGASVNETQTVTLSNGPAPIVTLATAPSANNTQTATLGTAAPGFGSDALSVALTGDSTFGVSANGGGKLALVAGKIVYTPGTITNAKVGTDVLNYMVTDTLTGAITTETQSVTLAVAPAVTSITGSAYGFSTITQTPGVTTITAFNYGNVIYASTNDVTITAGAGSDAAVGGDNNLTVLLNGYSDAVSAGNGNDTISGSQGFTHIVLGNGNDQISAGGFGNTVTAGNGTDTVSGGQGLDAISLGNGQDTVTESGFANIITVGTGNDTIVAGSGFDAVTTGGGNDTITLAGYGNKVTASGGNNTILASTSSGGNTLSLGNGNNTVTLGGSNNTVTLGNGINAVSSSGSGDVIKLSGGTASLAFSGSRDIAFLGGSSATITDTSSYLTLNVAPGGNDIIKGFGATRGGVIDLMGGNGGFTSAAAVVKALVSDGSGGTLLHLGTSSSIDFVGLTPHSLTAANFHID